MFLLHLLRTSSAAAVVVDGNLNLLVASLQTARAINMQLACRGYQQLGANVTRYQDGFQRDWHEAIDLYREVPTDANQVRYQ